MEHSSDRETEDDYQEENQCLNEQEKDELLNRLLLEVQELRRSNNNIEKEFKKVKKNKRLQREKVKLDLSCSVSICNHDYNASLYGKISVSRKNYGQHIIVGFLFCFNADISQCITGMCCFAFLSDYEMNLICH